MKEKGTLIMYAALTCFLFLTLVIPSATATGGWSRTYGGPERDIARSIVQTSDGGYALAGYTDSSGVWDSWLVKTDAAGNVQWNQTYAYDFAYSLVQTNDGGFALAGTASGPYGGSRDFWLVKTDANGVTQWDRKYEGEAYSLVQTSDGGYALAGWARSYEPSGGDFLLVKTDVNGVIQWNQTYGGTYGDNAYSVVQTSDGGYALAGITLSYGFGAGDSLRGGDFWLVKTDVNGVTQWNQTYGGTHLDYAYSVVQTSDGGYALAGYTDSYGAAPGSGGEGDFWLVKADASGTVQWNRTYGGKWWDIGYALVQTSDGGYAMAGVTYSHDTGDGDSLLVKVDSSGNAQWSRTYGGTSQDSFYSVIQTLDGGYALVGETSSYSVFWPDIPDFWLVKTDDTGIIPEFPSLFVIPLFLTLTIFATLVRRRKLRIPERS